MRTKRERGFTLVEMLIVVAIVGILAAMAIPSYRHAVIKAKEAVLAEDLWIMRDLISQFYVDQGKYPSSLDDLVDKRYLKEIPVDPFTGEAAWDEIPEEIDEEDPLAETGIMDVRSLSDQIGTNDIPYNEW